MRNLVNAQEDFVLIGTPEQICTMDQLKLNLAASPTTPEAERVDCSMCQELFHSEHLLAEG